MKLPFAPFTSAEHRDFILPAGRPAALLIHGFPGTPMEMRPLAEALHARGWTCRGLLLPGFGAEIESLPDRKATDWVAAIQAARRALAQEHAPVVLIGHSLGAALTLIAAAASGADGLILIAPFWRERIPFWGALPVIQHLLPQIKPFQLVRSEVDDPRLRQMVQDFLPELDLQDAHNRSLIRDISVPTSIFEQLRQAGRSALRSAPQVACPTLVIQGEGDTTVHPADTRRLLRRLGSAPHLVSLPGGHELVFASSQLFPAVVEAVLAFVGQWTDTS